MTRSTYCLLALTLFLSAASLFVGAADISPAQILSGDVEALHVLLTSRLPRLLAVLCTGAGMSIAGLIMQQLCANKFSRFSFCPMRASGAVRFLRLRPPCSARGSSCGS